MNPTRASGRRRQGSQTTRTVVITVLCAGLLIGIAAINGAPRSENGDDASHRAVVSAFALVSSGIVYVEPGTSDIVWKNANGEQKIIGENPWRNTATVRPGRLNGSPAWRQGRLIVGNPAHDVVSWVESTDVEHRDVVVVEASTGQVLARTPISAPVNRSVVIASVNDETVYFATPDPATGFPDVRGLDIWSWGWAAGEAPEAYKVDRFYNDVGAGTWALYDHGVVEFGDADRLTTATIAFGEDKPTDFGGALSPDGKYWYGAGTAQIVNTATGKAVTLPAARHRNYGWTGAAELTLTGPFMVCSAVTGRCRGPAGLVPDVCAPYGIACGSNLPIS